MNNIQRNTIQSILVLVLHMIFLCSYAHSSVVISTPVTGNYEAKNATDYQLLTTVSGDFTFNVNGTGTASLQVTSIGTISGNLNINKGTVSILLEAGSRISGKITDNAGNVPTSLSIYGTVDGGIDLNTQGNKTVTISGSFAEIGLISKDTISIKGTQTSASVYTISNGAVVNGSISLGNANDTVTVSNNASSGSILGTGGNKTITVSNSSTINGEISTGTNSGNNTIDILYSTVSNNITTGTSGNDTITATGSLITASIILGAGSDSLALQEATSVSGDVQASNALRLDSTFGSNIQGNLSVTNALTLNAPSGIRINGTTTSGINSSYNVNRSTFVGQVNLNGATTMLAQNSSFLSNIQANQSGVLNLRFNNTQGVNINAPSNTNTTSVFLENSSSFNEIVGGSGTNTISSASSTIRTIRGQNATVLATDSSIGMITVASRLQIEFTRSTLESALTTQAGSHITTLMAKDSIFRGNVSLLGNTTVNMTNSIIRGDLVTGTQSDVINIDSSTLITLSTSSGNDNVTISNTDINTISLGQGTKTFTATDSVFSLLELSPNQNTLTFTGSTFHQVIAPRQSQNDSSLRILKNNTMTGPYLTLGRGTMYLDGSLYITRSVHGASNSHILLQGTKLQIAEGGNIELSPQPYNSTTYLYFNEIANNSRSPVTTLHVNTFNGVKTILDLSHIKTYSNNGYIVHINGVLGRGKPLNRIEGVILSVAGLVPRTELEYALLSGNLYTLEESPTTPNTYDLVYQGVSPTNYGYAAAHNALRSFNTNIWHNLLSHFQEEENMFRDRDGRPRRAGSVVNAISIWARGGYSLSSIKPSFNTPQLNESSITFLAGLDFANISIGEDSSLLFQFFVGLGDLTSKFKDMPIERVSLKGHHTGITGGASLGLQKLTHQGRGKLYAIASLWYSVINNELDSNLFPEVNTWNNQSFSISTSFGYSIYIQRILITPQIDLAYLHTFKKTYITPDMSIVTFSEDQRMIGRASLLLGYAFPIGFTPYLRGGIEVPLFRGKSHGDVTIDSSPTPYSYDTTSFTTDVSLGIAYRGGVKHFSLTLSTEATILLGAKNGIEVFAQLGFQF